MTTDQDTTLTVGDRDSELNARPSDELDAFNTAATGVADRDAFSVRLTDAAGELLGGLSVGPWGDLCGIAMVWIREDHRGDGWGSRMLLAAEEEARRRGCDRVVVSSLTFQAPGFYQRHGYVETGRTLGTPGGHADVHMVKALSGPHP